MSLRALVLSPLLILLLAAPALAGGIVTSIADNGVEGVVYDSQIGAVRFYDDLLPTKGIEVGDEVIYNLNCGRRGCVATGLILVAPQPDRVITGNNRGDIVVGPDELVHVEGTITRDLVVNGGSVVLFEGAEIGRDLIADGGTVELNGATIGRDLDTTGTTVHASSAIIIRDWDTKKYNWQGVGEFVLMSGTSNGPAGTVDIGGDLTVEGNITIGEALEMNVSNLRAESCNNCWHNDGLVHASGDFVIDDASQLSVSGTGCIFVGGDIEMSASEGGPTVTGEVHAQGNIDFLSQGPVNLGGTIVSQGELNVDAGGDLLLHGVVGGGDVIFTSGESISITGSVNSGDFGLGGPPANDFGNVTIDSVGDLTISGDVSSGDTLNRPGGDITFTSGGAVYTHGSNIKANAPTIDLNPRLAPDVNIVAAGVVEVRGDVTSDAGDVVITSGSDTTVNGTLTAGDDLLVQGPGNLNLGGTISLVDGEFTFNAGTGMSLNLGRTFPEHYCEADVVIEVQFSSRVTGSGECGSVVLLEERSAYEPL